MERPKPQETVQWLQIIIVEEVKMSLLAKSCFAPGIISFVSNLIASSEDAEDENEEEWL